MATVCLATALGSGGVSRASSGDATLEPGGRGLQLLGAREAILREQAQRARLMARTRALALYRLLRTGSLAPAPALAPSAGDDPTPGARATSLLLAVLGRDLAESRRLRAELDRVRDERARLGAGAVAALPVGEHGDHAAERSEDRSEDPVLRPADLAAVPFQRPVGGRLVTPFGVRRDAATGSWSFRAAASYANRCGEPVLSPADGRVARVGESQAGGIAVVLVHARPPWVSILSRLRAVDVAPGDGVHRGDRLGSGACGTGASVRIETWRGRTPVDPAAVLADR